MSTPDARRQFKEAGDAMKARHAVRAETAPAFPPIPREKPSRRECLGCGLNRNAFDTRGEFDTHERICLFGGLGPGETV